MSCAMTAGNKARQQPFSPWLMFILERLDGSGSAHLPLCMGAC